MRSVDFEGANRQAIIVCYTDNTGNASPYVVTKDGATEYISGGYRVWPYSALLSCEPSDYAEYADFNGDGLDDVLYPAPQHLNGGIGIPSVVINTDPQSINRDENGSPRDANLAYPVDGHATALLIDYNLDEHPDILSSKSSSSAIISVYAYHGAPLYSSFQQQDPGLQVGVENALAVGDVTGDGLDDIVAFESGRFVLYARNGKKPDLMTRVVDGFGGETRFAYHLISNPSVYEPPSPTTIYSYPLRRVTGGLWVVWNHQVSNGISQQPTQYFHKYAQAIDDIQDHGFLGFGYHEVSWYEPATRVRKEWYDNATRLNSVEPYVGKPTKVDTLTYGKGGVVAHEEVVQTLYDTVWKYNNAVARGMGVPARAWE